jgi:hypothetical protein
MIDRKTALICTALIVLMFAAAFWRTSTPDDWTTLAVHKGATPFLFLFPVCSALVAGALYWNSRHAEAQVAKLRPWRKWGALLSIGYCGSMLLLQCVLIVESLDLDMPLHLSALASTLSVLMAIMALLAINRMPKLPYLERAFGPGAPLGPIYGPRYVRIVSRMAVAFMIAVFAYSLAAAPRMGWRSTLVILLATACLIVWSFAWRRHLARKWSLEQTQPPVSG